MSTILLDTHVLHWWSAEPDRLSKAAADVIAEAGEIAVAAITWFELAWLAKNERIALSVPIRAWLDGLSAQVLTLGITAGIAESAVALPSSFPGDPADRLIFATAVEMGLQLITKDKRLRHHRHPRKVTLW